MERKKPKKVKGARTKGEVIDDAQREKIMEAFIENCHTDLPQSKLCQIVGISRPTLMAWLKKYPDFARRVNIAKEETDLKVENSLRNKALGYRVKVQKPLVVSDGATVGSHVELVEYEEYIEPDIRAIEFWLCNRKPLVWSKSQKIDLSVYQSMSDEQLKEIVKQVVNDDKNLDDSEAIPE